MIGFLLEADANILLFIQEHLRTPLLTCFFTFITRLGDKGVIWILASCVCLFFEKTRKVGMMSLTALAGSIIVNNIILKNLVERTRPYEIVQGLEFLIEAQSDFSFPSGHTGSSFAAAYIFLKELPRRYGIPAIVLASLIGVSRLYLGVHYPSDVLAGVVLGILIACAVRKLFAFRHEDMQNI